MVLGVLGVHGTRKQREDLRWRRRAHRRVLDVLGVDEVVEERLGDAGEHGEGTGTGEGVGELAGLKVRAVARAERSEWQRRGQQWC